MKICILALFLQFLLQFSLQFALQFTAFSQPFSADKTAEYKRSDGHKGKFTLVRRQSDFFITLKQFCETFKCKVTYQWSQGRAVIHVTIDQSGGINSKAGAIVSPFASIAVVDGNLIEFDGQVVSDATFGYLIPLDLAKKIAAALDIGSVLVTGKNQEKPGILPPLPPPPPQSQQPSLPLRDFKLLVIDPGHGGNDYGAKFGELHEKDIALIYAKRLRDNLKKKIPDLRVDLTRENDEFISLPNRAKHANEKEAGLFISLHVNHAPDTVIQGSETYILNLNATDDDAKRTAMLENDSWLRSMKSQDQNATVLKILADMEQTKYIQSSALIAAYIQQELSAIDTSVDGIKQPTKNRGVKQAMFYVLSQAAMPSVLVEMGFLSNKNDRKRLMDMTFQDAFIEKMTSAIKRYKK